MDEKEQMNEFHGTPDAVTEDPPAVPPSAPEEPGRTGRLKRHAAREREKIYSIRKRKSGKGTAAGGEKVRGCHEIVEKRDIRYRGPLSYRHLMILGWLCIVLSQAGVVLGAAGRLDPGLAEDTAVLVSIGSNVKTLFLPLLLLANLSRILSAKQEFKTLLLKFGGLSALLGIAVPVVFEHYIMGLSGAADSLAKGLGEQFFLLVRDRVFKGGYLAYNIFVDLFLCTLFLFFLTYHFRRPVRRGRVICFRLLSILPVAYELACIVLKTMCKNGNISLPLYVLPFLTTKPPLMFAAFVALALYIKRREIIFLKNGRSYEEYGSYLETNTNSLHFSLYAFVIFIIAALIDMLLLALIIVLMTNDVMAIVKVSEQAAGNSEVTVSMLSRLVNVSEASGIGESVDLFFIAPLVLLYSYTRKHKNAMIDMAIPVTGVAAVAAIYVESFFQAACRVPDLLNTYLQPSFGIDLSQIDVAELKQLLTTLLE